MASLTAYIPASHSSSMFHFFCKKTQNNYLTFIKKNVKITHL